MKKMIVPTGRYLGEYNIFKCKRCGNEFTIIWNSYYSKTICFCPSCGQPTIPHKKNKEEEE